MLKKEVEYRESEENVAEMCEVNKYDFLENGKRF
jgi:hypothetical protein